MWNGTRGALIFFGTAKETEDRGALNGTFAGVTIRDGVVDGVVERVDDQGNVTYEPNTKKLPNGADQTFWRTRANSFTANNTEPFVEDAGWIRLREATLSYRIPGSVVNALGFLKGIDIFLTGRNLFLSTKYKGVDPETSLVGSINGQGIDYFNNPGLRSYGFGIRASF